MISNNPFSRPKFLQPKSNYRLYRLNGSRKEIDFSLTKDEQTTKTITSLIAKKLKLSRDQSINIFDPKISGSPPLKITMKLIGADNLLHKKLEGQLPFSKKPGDITILFYSIYTQKPKSQYLIFQRENQQYNFRFSLAPQDQTKKRVCQTIETIFSPNESYPIQIWDPQTSITKPFLGSLSDLISKEMSQVRGRLPSPSNPNDVTILFYSILYPKLQVCAYDYFDPKNVLKFDINDIGQTEKQVSSYLLEMISLTQGQSLHLGQVETRPDEKSDNNLHFRYQIEHHPEEEEPLHQTYRPYSRNTRKS